MSGIMMAVLGSGGGRTVTNGSGTLVIKTSYTYYYGFHAGGAPPSGSAFGSINNDTFSGATIKAVFSQSSPGSVGVNQGQAISYGVIFNGNRSAGFFNTLTVAGTLVSGTLGSPSYNVGLDETTFTITLASQTATLFGTTNGAVISVVLT